MLTSPLWVGGEIFVGFSLPIFLGVLIAAFDDKIRMRGYEQSEAAPRRLPSTGVFQLPALDAPQLGHSHRGRSWDAPRPRLLRISAPAQGDHVDRKGVAPAVTSRKAA